MDYVKLRQIEEELRQADDRLVDAIECVALVKAQLNQLKPTIGELMADDARDAVLEGFSCLEGRSESLSVDLRAIDAMLDGWADMGDALDVPTDSKRAIR